MQVPPAIWRPGVSHLSPTRRLAVALAALISITVIGMVGYMILEKLPVVDALYLTVVTLTTVGYGDLVPRTGAGRLFTVVLILSGVGSALYLFSVGAQLLLEGQLRDVFGRTAMQRRADQLDRHVILCGYGRFGRAVAGELKRNGAEMVVIDADPDREEEIRQLGVPYIIGSGLSDEVLERAGIRRARAIVVATPSDSDNVFISSRPARRIRPSGSMRAGRRRVGCDAWSSRAPTRRCRPITAAAFAWRPRSCGRRSSTSWSSRCPGTTRRRRSRRCGSVRVAHSRGAQSLTSSGNGAGCAWSLSSATVRRSGSCPNRRHRWRRT